jgi:hypothetical protein
MLWVILLMVKGALQTKLRSRIEVKAPGILKRKSVHGAGANWYKSYR